MSFTLINYSQGDPTWKSVKIGKSSETIGHVGCALTSVAMLVSGHGTLIDVVDVIPFLRSPFQQVFSLSAVPSALDTKHTSR
jgi:hypothetical protein